MGSMGLSLWSSLGSASAFDQEKTIASGLLDPISLDRDVFSH